MAAIANASRESDRSWPGLGDSPLAAGVFALEIVGILSRATNETGSFSVSYLADIPAATYLLLAVSSAALLWRKSRPLAVLVATLTAAIVWDALGLDGGPSGAIFVALYGVGRYIDDDRASVVAVATAVALTVVDDLIESEPLSVLGLTVVLALGIWYLGRRVRGRREYLALLEERTGLLEREKEAEAQRAVSRERNRIARELHDVVAHRVSMITVQAGAAQTVVESDPVRAVEAMEAVESAGRGALEELRQILGVLRSEDQENELAPIHGHAEIPVLVADIREAGVDVNYESEGVPEQLPASVDLASYRIVQEALTNCLKHACPSPRVKVRLFREGSMLAIDVDDDGEGDTSIPGAGQGLVGMRERAELMGGTFEAGPRLGGGYRVSARLPLKVAMS